jgi:hypothetical protein
MVGSLEVESRGRYLRPGIPPFSQHVPKVLCIGSIATQPTAQAGDGNGLSSPVLFGAPHSVVGD